MTVRIFSTVFSTLFIGILAIMMISTTSDENPHGDLKWDCQSCHSSESWQRLKVQMDFNHDETAFPLVGAHQTNDCMSCHQSLEFNKVGIACADCHTDIHRGQLGLDCQSCHSPTTWRDQQESFDLHAARGFPLTGVHTVLDCQACHTGEQQIEFAGLSAECSSCHISDFQLTANPSHVKAAFDLECLSCHQPIAVSWENARYEHPPSFEIKGAHKSLDCQSCHAETFAATPTECFSCHSNDFTAAQEPNHVTSNFPTDCMVCHTSDLTWDGAQFDHNLTGFALNGAHQTVDCASCHVNDVYAGTPIECFSCHESDYRATTDPNHVAANFPQNCLGCHSETAWEPAANFDHSQTNFALTGAHIQVDCASCHVNDVYAGTPTDCFSCHASEYNATTDPNHASAGFPTDCLSCHTTSAWEPANWDHDGQYFPIYSGTHRNEWNDCIDCHVTPGNFTRFECIVCHEHRKSEMDDEHDDVGGYVYESTACLNCHPSGNEKRAMFKYLDRVRR